MSGSSRRPKTASFSSSTALVRESFSHLRSFLHKYSPSRPFSFRTVRLRPLRRTKWGIELPRRAKKRKICKRYHMSEPLADPKVSHWPRQSAILERQFERAEGKKGVSRGTSRRNSYLGLDPGQKPACSSRPFWALT